MKNPTYTTLLIAVIYMLVWAGVMAYAFITVADQGATARALAITIAEQDAKEAAIQTTLDIVADTENERNALASYFVTEDDAISYLALIEGAAAGMGIEFETTELAVQPKTETTPGELKTSFRFTGTAAAMVQFLKALESLPYHSRIPDIAVTIEGGTWQGTVTVYTTLRP